MAYPSETIGLPAGIGTTASTDTFPTHYSELGKGGHRTTNTTTERNNITTERREFGMLVTYLTVKHINLKIFQWEEYLILLQIIVIG